MSAVFHAFIFRSSVVPDGYSAAQLRKYSSLRLQVLAGAFLCYSAYYLVRKNFVMAMPDLVEQGFSKSDLGVVLSALAISYGISNFFMGFVCDRIDTRKFMPLCLAGSACISLFLGVADIIQIPLLVLAIILALNGCFQGAGWPASAKLVAHWFHPKERGQAMGLWNLSHNAGCGLLGPISIMAIFLFADWQSKFYLPAFIALVTGLTCYFLIRDKPAIVGLPSPFPKCMTRRTFRNRMHLSPSPSDFSFNTA